MCEIPSNVSVHDRKLREEKSEEEEDLVDQLLKKSGCTEEHYLVQECMVEHQVKHSIKTDTFNEIVKLVSLFHSPAETCFC